MPPRSPRLIGQREMLLLMTKCCYNYSPGDYYKHTFLEEKEAEKKGRAAVPTAITASDSRDSRNWGAAD